MTSVGGAGGEQGILDKQKEYEEQTKKAVSLHKKRASAYRHGQDEEQVTAGAGPGEDSAGNGIDGIDDEGNLYRVKKDIFKDFAKAAASSASGSTREQIGLVAEMNAKAKQDKEEQIIEQKKELLTMRRTINSTRDIIELLNQRNMVMELNKKRLNP